MRALAKISRWYNFFTTGIARTLPRDVLRVEGHPQNIFKTHFHCTHDFLSYEFAWFATTKEDFDNANSKIRNVTPYLPVDSGADFVVLLTICGLLYAFMILSADSPKDDASNCEMSQQVETIPMAFEDKTTSIWSSRPTNSQLIRCCDSPVYSRNVLVETREISRPAVSKSSVSATRRLSEHNMHSSHLHTCAKTQTSRLVAQTAPRKWLVRRTRSGHIYGKYSV